MEKKLSEYYDPRLAGRIKWEVRFHAADGDSSAQFILKIDDEVIWCYPTDYYTQDKRWDDTGKTVWKFDADYSGTRPEVTIRKYMALPKDRLFDPIDRDFQLADILRACDKRLGFKRLMWWAFFEMEGGRNPARKVLKARYPIKERRSVPGPGDLE